MFSRFLKGFLEVFRIVFQGFLWLFEGFLGCSLGNLLRFSRVSSPTNMSWHLKQPYHPCPQGITHLHTMTQCGSHCRQVEVSLPTLPRRLLQILSEQGHPQNQLLSTSEPTSVALLGIARDSWASITGCEQFTRSFDPWTFHPPDMSVTNPQLLKAEIPMLRAALSPSNQPQDCLRMSVAHRFRKKTLQKVKTKPRE